jgi:hypothetical protein
MRGLLWTGVALAGLVIAACFVPALEDLEDASGRSCNEAHSCMGGYACVEEHCQPEQGTACRQGATAACGFDTGECQQGIRTCGPDGKYGPCLGGVAPVAESCNGQDDDCDGASDEGLTCGDAGDSCEACTSAGRTCADGQCGGCLEGYFEQGEQCQPQRAQGETCGSQGECASAHCVDGVCCNGACEGACESCAQVPGTCAPLADGSTGDPSCAPYLCDGSKEGCPTQCQANEDCASGVFCINGHCGDKLPPGAACSGAAQCATGYCVGGFCCGTSSCQTPPGQCQEPSGTCANGTCSYAPKTAGASCDDGNACTVNDTCDGSGSCAGTLKQCNTPTSQCQQSTGTCSNGTCSYELKPAGAACDDGNACTQGDACSNVGVCTGASLVCNSPPSQCYAPAGACSNGKCDYTPKAAGASCDDGNACTVNDTCNGSGSCGGTPKQCNTPTSQCQQSTGTCSNGTCSYALKPTGSACDDSSSCTTGDVCSSAGVCAGSPTACNSPPNSCYQPAGTCANGTCSYTPKAAGTGCDDGNTCTVNDVCNGGGVCAGSAIICNSPTNQCQQSTGTCSNGACSYPLKPAGSACNDGNACTTGDACSSSGACAGTALVCSPPSQCYQAAGTCSNGSCSYVPKASGSSCDDGNACTTNDHCDGAGTCVVTNVTCNSPPDQCSQSAGTCSNGICSYPPKPGGSSCNDGNSCTTGDICNGAGTCSGSTVACNSPPSQCHQATGTCSGGTCSYALKPTGSSCNDGNACTTGDACNSSGVCVGTTLDCNSDAPQCYSGTCVNGSCQLTPSPVGSYCYLSGPCAHYDYCDGSGYCVRNYCPLSGPDDSVLMSVMPPSEGESSFLCPACMSGAGPAQDETEAEQRSP